MKSFIEFLLSENAHPVMRENGALELLSAQTLVIRWPLHDMWFCRNHEQWKEDINFETGRRVPHCCIGKCAWRNNVDVFALLAFESTSLCSPCWRGVLN